MLKFNQSKNSNLQILQSRVLADEESLLNEHSIVQPDSKYGPPNLSVLSCRWIELESALIQLHLFST